MVGQLATVLQGGGGHSGGHLLLQLQGDVAELLLDVMHDFPLGGDGEAAVTLREHLHEIVGQVPATVVQAQDGVGRGWEGVYSW